MVNAGRSADEDVTARQLHSSFERHAIVVGGAQVGKGFQIGLFAFPDIRERQDLFVALSPVSQTS